MANPLLKRPGSARDPLWYKDAIIYELYVRAFFDSNNDGVGDFPGLIQKLDYLQELGVTCLWLLPFFPSPLRDDGYDISDYLNVHPAYGTLEDFQTFLAAAHDRGMQVMVELVVNHTSDQHPWFQAARKAPAGSPERDYYVWSDSDQKYGNARIIFTDTEKSNWTWDSVAQAYYWHRFFSHQPDLNYDNPVVLEKVIDIMRFWLDMGVDGLRLDAIPYLVERDGTSCENLPETHAVLKKLREAMDSGYEDRMILAEANQWPTDVRAYFAEGDECHMAFHFPLMPRIFMALRLEDRLPILEIMGQTPEIPETCQWGLFLRNHDELTLEMVNDEERDYMYLAYSADPRMRVNVGIRRRLGPLMENNRRRVELLNSLLLSFPGTPILYYGDEIGMGDNIYLGDRNGVRTPMQWSADRNGGFSRANPARLFSPVVMDPVYGYEAVNVEAQQGDPSSLLSWTRNLIALRKLFRVFGRGSIEFLHPANRKILAYVRHNQEGEQVLCVANLSRFAQPVDLNLEQFEGMRPVEMLGYVEFPLIGKQPYPLTLGPYAFLWFELQATPEQAEMQAADTSSTFATVAILRGWEPVFDGPQWVVLQRVLPEYLQKQRWFGLKSRRISQTSLVDWAELAGTQSALILVKANYEDQGSDLYLLCLAAAFGNDAGAIRSNTPAAILCPAVSAEDDGVVYDGLLNDATCLALLAAIGEGLEIPSAKGRIRGVPAGWFAHLHPQEPLAPRRSSTEQNNTSITFGDRLILKLFRRPEPGPNPDCEISKYLTEKTDFNRVPPFAGLIEYTTPGAEPTTLAMLQGLVANEGDGWNWNQEELARYYEEHARIPFEGDVNVTRGSCFELSESEPSALAREHLGIGLDSAVILGRRTAEMHVALAAAKDDPDFSPEPISQDSLHALAGDFRAHAIGVLELLKENLSRLSDDLVEQGGLLLARRRELLHCFQTLDGLENGGLRTRVHGDFHLRQVLRVKQDYVILDFEGEPARSLAERRAKQSPLKDVAGMLRSFSYAAHTGLMAYVARHPNDFERLLPWTRLWELATMTEFLRAYGSAAAGAAFLPAQTDDLRTLLAAYVLDKALYELRYELNYRPAWVGIPATGILSLLP